MSDISQHMPKQSETVKAIYAHYKKVGDSKPVRGYLGASIIGHPCERFLWYCFRQCCKPSFDGRMYRLFETGDLEEFRFVKDLRDIGCTVHDVDENAARVLGQFEVMALGGHFSGHMDGCALGIPEAPSTWHVLEFKTHCAKSFTKLKKDGVKKSKPQHWAQMQVYMHLTGMKRALYMAVNKDNDEIYAERIHYDESAGLELIERARRVITSTSPPGRISERRDYYQCGWCDSKEICWGSNRSALPVPSLSCRQCCHATPVIDETTNAMWKCEKTELYYSHPKPCNNHLTLPGLLEHLGEPANYGTDDKGQNFIEFAQTDGTAWKHGNAEGCYSSKELTELPPSVIGNKMITTAKELFGSTAVDAGEDILSRYPEEDSRKVWAGPAVGLVAAWKVAFGDDLHQLTPVAKCTDLDCRALEFDGGRVAIVWSDDTAEIREGKE